MSRWGLTRRLLASVAVFAPLIALVVSLKPDGERLTGWDKFWLAAFVLLMIVDVYFDVRDYLKLKPRVFKNDRQIRDYMFNWIDRGACVRVFSRDMSWVNDDEMRALLERKARAKELTLVLPAPITLSTHLSKFGAEVLIYPRLKLALQSRLTIVREGRIDTAVAIGRTVGANHHVTEYRSADSDPAFFLAQDLASVLGVYCAGPDENTH